MKEELKKIYHVNTGWWDSFSSCFIGTLLGIGITFGISWYNAEQEKLETERRIQIMMVGSIEREFESFRSIYNDYKQKDSIISNFLGLYNKKDEIPRELLNALMNSLISFKFNSLDSSYEKVFSNNIEVWKSMKFNDVKTLGEMLSGLRMIGDIYSQINNSKNVVVDNINKEIYLQDENVDYKDVIDVIYKKPENFNALLKMQLYINLLGLSLDGCERHFEQIKKNMNVTDEELSELEDDRYDDIQINKTIDNDGNDSIKTEIGN